MPKIIYHDIHGCLREVEVPVGSTLMEGAVDNGVEGIVAECGGACACATCHAYIDDAWIQRLDPPGEMEDAMLDSVIDRRPNSRLTCQIEVTADLAGLELYVAKNEV